MNSLEQPRDTRPINKSCPWCGARISFYELLRLDDHVPRRCRACARFVVNARQNAVVPIVVPLVLGGLATYLFDYGILLALPLLALVPVLRVLLAEPRKMGDDCAFEKCARCRDRAAEFALGFAKVCGPCLGPDERAAAVRTNQEGQAPRRLR